MSHKPDDSLPTEDLFDDGITFSETLFDEVSRFKLQWEDIDWGTEIDSSAKVQELTGTAATQFQYANMSHLILCGKIIKNEARGASLDAKKLAILLSAYKAEGIDVWGRYLQKIEPDEPVSSRIQRFYRRLFSEERVLPAMIAMETLAGPLACVVYSKLQRVGDDVFQQIAAKFVPQKEQEIELAETYLQPAVQQRADQEQQALAENATEYRRMASSVLGEYSSVLSNVGIDPVRTQEQVDGEIIRFYQGIGLPVDT